MKNKIKDILIIWALVLAPLTIVGDLAKAAGAFYRQVIKNESLIQLQILPSMFLPVEGFDRSRSYCGLRKVSVPSLPKVETV